MTARVNSVRFFFLLFLATVVLRLFYWQVVRAEELQAMADKQHLSSSIISASRGLIHTADNYVLVSNKTTYLLYGLPKVIKDVPQTASKLASVLTSQSEEKNDYYDKKEAVAKKLSQDLYWVLLEKNITEEQKAEIEALQLVGVGFEPLISRFYPEGSSSAHVLGFVAEDVSGRPTGYFGVEGFYNGELKGVDGTTVEEKDAKGLPIILGRFLKKEARSGNDLVLTIDRTIQHILEQRLKEGMQKYGASGASAVVMEPASGKVLGMATLPNYDPAIFQKFPKEVYKNPVVAGSYEPGSTFKTLIMAAAINEGVVEADTKCDSCSGPLAIAGYSIRTWNNKYQEDITMAETIIHSDNTGMVYAGRRLGLDRLYDYIQKFGFGNLTEIDLQDETTPEIRSKSSWGEIDLATASFGQGIAVTPIQMVRAVATIANGGLLMQPQIVSYIKTPKKTIEVKPKVVGNPITSKTAKTITEMMVQAVDKGESRVYKPKGFKIAGKTGTAQIPVAGHYDATKTIASFVGFAPADSPKFVMLVRYDQPSSSIYGSETAAPTFFAIAKELFTYYGIAPEE